MTTILISLLGIIGVSSGAEIVKGVAMDMALFKGDDRVAPFLISIFETSCAEVKAIGAASNCAHSGNKENNFPALMRLVDAEQYCQRKGMRLPTVSQWRAAAANGNSAKRYSTLGDIVVGGDGTFVVNIRSFLKKEVYLTDRLGIDEIGTVAMSGNAEEWAVGESGDAGAYGCGGSNGSTGLRHLELRSTCRLIGARESQGMLLNPRCVLPNPNSLEGASLSALVTEKTAHLAVVQRSFEGFEKYRGPKTDRPIPAVEEPVVPLLPDEFEATGRKEEKKNGK